MLNRHGCLYEYYKESIIVVYRMLNCYYVYEYYEESIVVVYRMLNCYRCLYVYF
jgi:hypothetical protein